MLAKNVTDYACFLNERGAWVFFASKLALTQNGPNTNFCSDYLSLLPKLK